MTDEAFGVPFFEEHGGSVDTILSDNLDRDPGRGLCQVNTVTVQPVEFRRKRIGSPGGTRCELFRERPENDDQYGLSTAHLSHACNCISDRLDEF